ncbi:hypothetical protein CGLO_03055 [Colletotrichum gloeosporioides Cg-14]|uniref:Uncharacterized protein n=1 Tax=Colletotrichum gloeosporioides (strain Cg-14) TaxID=1237896 RepID=T0M7D4_COLGC|nr:hypothetical protein CGLO_03055 [Colletotrichum gloeosporioides Cg-14]
MSLNFIASIVLNCTQDTQIATTTFTPPKPANINQTDTLANLDIGLPGAFAKKKAAKAKKIGILSLFSPIHESPNPLHLALCVSVASWLPGFLASWLPGFLASWLPGFLASWLHGFMASWLHGFMASWLHGFTTSWLPLHRPSALLFTGI